MIIARIENLGLTIVRASDVETKSVVDGQPIESTASIFIIPQIFGFHIIVTTSKFGSKLLIIMAAYLVDPSLMAIDLSNSDGDWISDRLQPNFARSRAIAAAPTKDLI